MSCSFNVRVDQSSAQSIIVQIVKCIYYAGVYYNKDRTFCWLFFGLSRSFIDRNYRSVCTTSN